MGEYQYSLTRKRQLYGDSTLGIMKWETPEKAQGALDGLNAFIKDHALEVTILTGHAEPIKMQRERFIYGKDGQIVDVDSPEEMTQ